MSIQPGSNGVPSIDSTLANGPHNNPRRRVRRLLFRLLVVVFPVFSLILGEAGLRFWGYGSDFPLVTRLTPGTASTTCYLNPAADAPYCRDDLRGPEPRAFEMPRPTGELRILVVGASSVQGYPFSSELSFPRQLEYVLSTQLPGKNINVLNAGIVGLSTLPLCDLVQQCEYCQPSLVVLYAGHNEFYGVGGVCTNSELTDLQISLHRGRLMQLLSPGAGSDLSSETPLISRIPGEFRIPPRSPLIRQAELHFEQHVRSIAAYCEQIHIPILLVTPVCNLRGQSPLPLDGQRERLRSIEQQVGQTLSQSSADRCLSLLQSATAVNPDDACLHYRLAQSLELLASATEARFEYSLARDLDACRYRASSRYADILRAIADSSDGRATFVDAQEAFNDTTRYCVPGDDLFLEHVHFTLDGH
jgi:hypothetical protein